MDLNNGDDENQKKKKSVVPKIIRTFFYTVCLIILGTTAYRLISTATPGDLKNYIIKSQYIEQKHDELKKDFVIYSFKPSNAFMLVDAMFVEKAYYLESAENFQVTIRCKNKVVRELLEFYTITMDSPFKYYLNVYPDFAEDTENYIVLKPVSQETFGKDKDRYKYFVVSFDGVEIDYKKTKIELCMYLNDGNEEEEYVESITLFNIGSNPGMTQKKIQAGKFNW